MITTEEWKKRHNYIDSRNVFCELWDCGRFPLACHMYTDIDVIKRIKNSYSEEDRNLIDRCANAARIKNGWCSPIGYPCIIADRWILGLDDDLESSLS